MEVRSSCCFQSFPESGDGQQIRSYQQSLFSCNPIVCSQSTQRQSILSNQYIGPVVLPQSQPFKMSYTDNAARTSHPTISPQLSPIHEPQEKSILSKCEACRKRIVNKKIVSCEKCNKRYHPKCKKMRPSCRACGQQFTSSLRLSLSPAQLPNTRRRIKPSRSSLQLPTKPSKQSNQYIQITNSHKDPVQINSQASLAHRFSSKHHAQLAQLCPYYFQKDCLNFPIQDSLLLQFPLLTQHGIAPAQKYPQGMPLPTGFSKILEIWNLVTTFPQFFSINCMPHLDSFLEQMIQPKMTQIVNSIFESLLNLLVEDLCFNRLEDFNQPQTGNFLQLLKFVKDTGLDCRIIRLAWPKICEILIETGKRPNQRKVNSPLLEDFLSKQKNRQQEISEVEFLDNVESRLELLSHLTSVFVETSLFREVVNELTGESKPSSKQTFEIEKRKRWNSKPMFNDVVYTKGKKQLQRSVMLDKEDTYHQNSTLNMFSVVDHQGNRLSADNPNALHSPVEEIEEPSLKVCFLGTDSYENLYWHIACKPKELYVERAHSKWYVLNESDIPTLLGCLSPLGIKSSRLAFRVQEIANTDSHQFGSYAVSLNIASESSVRATKEEPICQLRDQDGEVQPHELQGSQAHMETQNKQSWNQKGSKDRFQFDFSKIHRLDRRATCKIVIESEYKMCRYLQSRQARWANEETASEFIRFIQNDTASIKEFAARIASFNEKICVVEAKDGFSSKPEPQQSRLRKIQTKIWGIKENYKHLWYDFGRRLDDQASLAFWVAVLYLNVDKYTSKVRKIRKSLINLSQFRRESQKENQSEEEA